MRQPCVVCCVLAAALLVGLAPGASGIAAGEEPTELRAEAGLDQTVQQNTTVYLDAGGSQAPDGEIAAYEWEIERPDGVWISPECPDCERTSFEAVEPGEYNVTLTVWDDAGRSARDAMNVTVVEATAPNVSLAGPEYVAVGDAASVEMNASAGDANLSSVVWIVDGEQRAATFLDGDEATDSIGISTAEAGTTTVDVLVTDENGVAVGARHEVTILESSEFDVELTDVDAKYVVDETIEPTVTVTNTGPIEDTQEIVLEDFAGEQVDSEWLTLDPGEQAILSDGFWTPTLSWTPDGTVAGETGEITACSGTDCDDATVSIFEKPTFELERVAIDEQRNTYEFEATVTNTGGVKDTQAVEFCVSCGNSVSLPGGYSGYQTLRADLRLAPGESATVTEQWPEDPLEDERGTHEIRFRTDDDSATTTLDLGPALPYHHFAVSFSLPSEIEVGEHVYFGQTVVVWPNNHYGQATETYSPSGYANEFHHSLVWQRQYSFKSSGDVSGSTGHIVGKSAGRVEVCYADTNTEYGGAGLPWGSCETTTVVGGGGGSGPKD